MQASTIALICLAVAALFAFAAVASPTKKRTRPPAPHRSTRPATRAPAVSKSTSQLTAPAHTNTPAHRDEAAAARHRRRAQEFRAAAETNPALFADVITAWVKEPPR